ncbi:MAG TPA: Ig-like domain-containing protein [Thermoclostridium sp.]|nr:Ig-like domain-containing protein [Thermoclostridium sp.]
MLTYQVGILINGILEYYKATGDENVPDLVEDLDFNNKVGKALVAHIDHRMGPKTSGTDGKNLGMLLRFDPYAIKATDEVRTKLDLTAAATSISMEPTIENEVGERQKLKYTVQPSNAIFGIPTYPSSDTSVVTVGETGMLTAVKARTSIITVNIGDLTQETTVTVPAPYAEIEAVDYTKMSDVKLIDDETAIVAISDWNDVFDGTTQNSYTLTAEWDIPVGWTDAIDPISITIKVLVETVQTESAIVDSILFDTSKEVLVNPKVKVNVSIYAWTKPNVYTSPVVKRPDGDIATKAYDIVRVSDWRVEWRGDGQVASNPFADGYTVIMTAEVGPITLTLNRT